MNLPPDATIGDVVGTLRNREAYVLNVYHHMRELEREHGALELRIGIKGAGKVPHYRFDTVERLTLLDEVGRTGGVVVSVPLAAFDGRNHERLVAQGEEPDTLRNTSWSAVGSTYAEVEDVFRKLRGIAPGAKK